MTQSLTGPHRLSLLLLGVVSLVALVAAGYLVRVPRYTVYDGDRPLVVSGDFTTVAEVLAAAGVETGVADLVFPERTGVADPATAIQVRRAREVLVTTDDGARRYHTHQPSLGAFFDEIGLTVQRADRVIAAGRLVPFGELSRAPLTDAVEVSRFLTITILDGAEQHVLRSAAQTVGGALREAGLTLYAADGVEPAPGAWLAPDMTITIRRSQPVTIHVDGRTIQTRSHQRLVGDVLAETGIGLVGFDYTVPDVGAPFTQGGAIQVIRVTESFRLEDEPIPFESRWQGTDQFEIDTRVLLQQGVPGIQRRRIRIRYENGVEVGQREDGQWVAQEPQPELLGYGTRIVPRVIDTPEGPREYWRQVRMRVTSYSAATSGKPRSHPAYGITASGVPSGFGVVAVDPRVVPFRSEVFVPGYGVAFVGDTGGGVKGRWIDLGYPDGDFYGDFPHWSGYVDVYYLTPIPAPDKINYLIPTWLP